MIKIVIFNDDFKNDKTTRQFIQKKKHEVVYYIYICIHFIKRYGFSMMLGRSTIGIPMNRRA